MTNTTVNSTSILTPEQVGELVIKPLLAQSVAAQVSTVVRTDSNQYRVPIVAADPDTSWTPEGTEITADDLDLAELVITPKKVAGLTVVSNELLADSSEDAAKLVGSRLVNSLRRKVDAAYFSASTPNGPSGVPSLVGNGVTNGFTGTANAFGSNLDVFGDLASQVEIAGGKLTAWAVNPFYGALLGKIKEATGSNKPLLGPDPSQQYRRVVGGVPVLHTPDIASAVMWGITKEYSLFVLRQDADVQVDSSAFFTSDRTAIRCTLRVGFGFPHPAAIAQLRLATS
ncbi:MULTISPECIES: phage major capsid protein [Mycobacterium]|uniref:Phage capsid-like C-terminal domain-containing protein n=1 Tax=Mycobacterium kiyosense TaxID=2871094 RepID=A0A9P3Q6Z6_9MYCO|nr:MULTISPECIES: phage major capsid protein [Mycobacterium]BDB43847.1 hypothetical protein IWGMT90018_42930 [Mycobacterium kiyosense]BDE15404.1 hypothetical protein MKCMC460_42640 [Mycobacterium sp. 20KCMC460]GLB82708.1 hypothetical protein SRL2020028_19640 [Mycobacterium kiyosense]GLB90171.1 hypothetical protein SRL2020130_29880 [Mycobacterium kiyosense]GLB95760.1 hypothetical protein SRL2020226_25360 [Mycobacterium kiyosense]